MTGPRPKAPKALYEDAVLSFMASPDFRAAEGASKPQLERAAAAACRRAGVPFDPQRLDYALQKLRKAGALRVEKGRVATFRSRWFLP